MNSEDKFWACVWGMIATIIIVVAFCITLYWISYDKKVVSMIESGVPPIEAVCALQNGYGRNATCLVLASRK